MCDDSWGTAEAQVVCRQLGYPSSSIITGYFGQGTGSIYLDDVKCVGIEYSLLDCNYTRLSHHSCNHSTNAAVRCGGKFHTTAMMNI